MGRRLALLAVGIIVAGSLAELLAVGAYYLETGTLFYRSGFAEPAVESPTDATSPDLDRLDPRRATRLANRAHPFFGFVKFPNPEKQVNLQGFVSAPYDYPLQKTAANQFFIGIFGGSVSARFSADGSRRLIERLKRAPDLRDRDIRVLNFGSGGYKQPQQLLILSYYLVTGQSLDMVINIDGFNEVALSRLNRDHDIDVDMPSADQILPIVDLLDAATSTPERVEVLARIYSRRAAIARLGERIPRARLAILWFVEERWRRMLTAALWKDLLAYQDLAGGPTDQSLFYVYPAVRRLSDTELYETIARHWGDASVTMHQMLLDRGIPYYHFLQPNQYYSRKYFGPAESAVALRENHPYRIGVEKGYPVLESVGKSLAERGVHFFSAVALFDDERRPIYKDDCCHLNQLGNEELADFIAESILDGRGQ